MNYNHINQIVKVVPLLGTAFLFSCTNASKIPSLASIIPIDITTLSGEGPKAKSNCDDGAVYRYTARTNGPNARMDNFCIQEDLQDRFVHQPPPEMKGECQAEFCGMTTAAHRYPIEYALLQAAVSLERVRKVKLGSKALTFDDGIHSEDIFLYFQTVKFDLSPGVHCVSKLEEYEEHLDQNSMPEVEHVLALERLQSGEKKYVYNRSSLISGSIFMEQIHQKNLHSVLLIVETKYEETEDAAIWVEKTLCKSKKGPISLRESQYFSFYANSINREEWSVTTSWKE